MKTLLFVAMIASFILTPPVVERGTPAALPTKWRSELLGEATTPGRPTRTKAGTADLTKITEDDVKGELMATVWCDQCLPLEDYFDANSINYRLGFVEKSDTKLPGLTNSFTGKGTPVYRIPLRTNSRMLKQFVNKDSICSKIADVLDNANAKGGCIIHRLTQDEATTNKKPWYLSFLNNVSF